MTQKPLTNTQLVLGVLGGMAVVYVFVFLYTILA